MNSTPPSESSSTTVTDDQPVPPTRAKSGLVTATIIFTVLAGLGMVALVYVGWLRHAEPASMIYVEADEASDGVTIKVRRFGSNNRVTKTIPVILSEANGYMIRFYLEPGAYEVVAERSDFDEINFGSVQLGDGRAVRVPLKGRFPSTRPATDPAESKS